MAHKLINDLTKFYFSAGNRASIEIQRADQTVTKKTSLRDKEFNREMECIRERIWTDEHVGNATMTIIPVYSASLPTNERLFLVTIEVYLSSGIAGNVESIYVNPIPSGFRPPTRMISYGLRGEGGEFSYVRIDGDGSLRVFVAAGVDSWQGVSFSYTTG